VALVRTRTIPTKRPPLVGEVMLQIIIIIIFIIFSFVESSLSPIFQLSMSFWIYKKVNVKKLYIFRRYIFVKNNMILDRAAVIVLHLTIYYVEQVVILECGKLDFVAWTTYNDIIPYKLSLNSVN
jgi:hypothetical protein